MASTTRARRQRRPPANPLVDWRTRHSFSQRDAAVAIGCSRAAWQNWENGTSDVPGYIRLAMAAVDAGIQLDQIR